MSIEQRIRSTLHEAAESFELPNAARLPDRGHENWSPSRKPLLAFAFGFVVIVLLGAVIWALAPRGDSNVATPETRQELSLSDAPLEWTQIEALPAGSNPELLVEGPAGWLIVAPPVDRTNGWIDATVLQSDDGVDWEVLASPGFASVVHVDGAVGTDDRYLAYGLFAGPEYTSTTLLAPSNFPTPAVWTSEDGVDWDLEPLPLPALAEQISSVVSYRIGDAAIRGDVAVVVGTEFDEDLPAGRNDVEVPTRQVIWVSITPGEWTVLQDTRLTEGQRVQAVAAGPAGVIVVTLSGEGSQVWASTDGIAWDAIGVIPSNGFALAVSGSDTGYVASIGTDLWFSPDGSVWTAVDQILAPRYSSASQTGFIVNDAAGDVYWSPDGNVWIVAGTEPSLPTAMAVSAAGVSPYAVIVIGQSSGDVPFVISGTPHRAPKASAGVHLRV